jgi:hypothetical protein
MIFWLLITAVYVAVEMERDSHFAYSAVDAHKKYQRASVKNIHNFSRAGAMGLSIQCEGFRSSDVEEFRAEVIMLQRR